MQGEEGRRLSVQGPMVPHRGLSKQCEGLAYLIMGAMFRIMALLDVSKPLLREDVMDFFKARSLALFALLSCAYAALTYALCLHTLSLPMPSDLIIHAQAVQNVWVSEGFLAFFSGTSYPGWHAVVRCLLMLGLELPYAASLACALFAFLTGMVVFYAASLLLGPRRRILHVVVVGVILLFVTAIYLPVFNSEVLLGQGSPTIWHNPTYNAVKPVALISVLVLFDVLRSRTASTGKCIALAVLSVVGLALKPSLFQVFLPSVCLYALIDYILNRDFAFVRNLVLTFVPSLAYVAVQFYIMLCTSAGGGDGIGFTFFGVWAAVSPDVFISALLLLAFPLFALVALRKELFARTSPYWFIVIFLAMGFLQYSFLMENGPRMLHGNFGWGFFLALFISWVFLLSLFVKKAFVEKDLAPLYTTIGTVLVALHFLSGLYYYGHLMTNALWV